MPNLSFSNGGQSTINVNVIQDYVPVDFSAHTRFKINFYGRNSTNNFTLDTAVTAGVITGSSAGVLTISLATAQAAMDSYVLRVIGYSPTYPLGYTYFDPCCGALLNLKVCGNPAPLPADGAYFEGSANNVGYKEYFAIGVSTEQYLNTATDNPAPYAATWMFSYSDDDGEVSVYSADTRIAGYAVSPGSSFNIGVAVNPPNMWVSFDGTWLQGDPSTGASPSITSVPTGTALYAAIGAKLGDNS